MKDFDLLDEAGRVLEAVRDHRHARYEWRRESPLVTMGITLRVLGTHGGIAAVFRVRCWRG